MSQIYTISRFHLITHYISGGEFITRNYICDTHRIPVDPQTTTLTLATDLLKPKLTGFDRVSRTTILSAKFQLIPIRGFRFIVLTYTPIHKHTYIVTK